MTFTEQTCRHTAQHTILNKQQNTRISIRKVPCFRGEILLSFLLLLQPIYKFPVVDLT